MTAQRTEQQDVAAGGAAFRKVRLENNGAATASVEVITLPKGYQEWAFLRFKTGGKTRRLYVGKVTSETREQSLALGWKLVHEKQVLEKAGLAWLMPLKTAKRKTR